MMTHEFSAYLGFSYMPGIGPTKFDHLLSHFSSVKDAYEAPEDALRAILGAALTEKYIRFRTLFDFDSEYRKIEDADITVLTREDAQFPPQLLEISDPPICLYVKGDLERFQWDTDFFFAIVGTRKPTEYGNQVAKKFSRELAAAGCTIVSGLAAGIDAIAHATAIDAGGRTVAFLGCGVNIVYPWENRHLYQRILESGSIICSEFPPDKTTIKGHFIARNRLISGLSKGVLVAEGLKDSGSLITARYALQQGKDVFAPPAPITSDQSQAPNLLLKEGAKMVTNVEDILEEYGLRYMKQKQDIAQRLPEEQKQLFQLLSQEAFTSDELARILHVPIYQVLTVLSTMELSGIIEKNRAGKYQVRI